MFHHSDTPMKLQAKTLLLTSKAKAQFTSRAPRCRVLAGFEPTLSDTSGIQYSLLKHVNISELEPPMISFGIGVCPVPYSRAGRARL
jgi:hypothetical protein